MFWFNQLPEDVLLSSGYKTNLPFIEGGTINIRTKPYFDLVFRLVKSMIDSYHGDGALSREALRSSIKAAETPDDLIRAARRHDFNDNGFVISTQVPSLVEPDIIRHDGVLITLAGSAQRRVSFIINHVTTRERTEAYGKEIKILLSDLYQQVKKKGLGRVDFDSVLSTLLSMAYYLYNLMPLTRGSGFVTYSVLVGIVMAMGREVTGKVPMNKMLEMEALLSGAPDAFVVVTQQWLDIQK